MIVLDGKAYQAKGSEGKVEVVEVSPDEKVPYAAVVPHQAEVIFRQRYEMTDKEKQFISELMEIRHDKCSTIFCSQYPSGDWYDKLHKSTLTEALLDRIIHNRIDVYMGNENFRIKK